MPKLCIVRFFKRAHREKPGSSCMYGNNNILSSIFMISIHFFLFSHLCWDAQHRTALFMDLWQIEKRYEGCVVAVLCDGLVSLIFHCALDVVVVVETNRFCFFSSSIYFASFG